MVRTRKFWLLLLLPGLLLVFQTSVYAVDVKFSGVYYIAGVYLDKTNLVKETTATNTALGSTAFYFQKLQLTTEFVIMPSVSLVTRANIMERVWGGPRTAPGTALDSVGPDFPSSAATRAENENIGLDYAYLRFITPVGLFQAGYMADSVWGTVFHDSERPAGKVSYILPIDKWVFGAEVIKPADNSYSASNITSTQTDADTDKYCAYAIYIGKNFESGMIYVYFLDAGNRPASGVKSKFHIIEPYFKVNIGPVKIQAELDYYFGDLVKFDTITDGFSDQKVDSLAGWIDATATFGPFYVGGTFAYSQGQGTDSSTLNELAGSGKDWSPTLIMWNSDRNYWLGNINGYGASKFRCTMTNAFFYQLKAGLRPTDKLDVSASVAFAHADTLNDLTYAQTVIGASMDLTSKAGYVSRDYGWEIDVVGTYKITNNLSYMAGFGYLFTGDYFKATSNANAVANDYLLINKLTFTF